jgi:hypothetical protein
MIERPSYLRAIEPFIGTSVIKVLVGVRRAGKSTVLLQVRNELLKRGVSPERLVTLNFESNELAGVATADDLYACVAERLAPEGTTYLFLDEIQEVEGWERALRSLLVDRNVDLYVTGSNAHLLSSELATLITGRYVQIPVYPLSFREYLDGLSQVRPVDSRTALRAYLVQGGFPFQTELAFAEKPTLQYVEGVYSTVLLKDVVRRNAVRDTDLLARVLRYVIEQVGHTFSAKNLAAFLKSESRSASLETIYGYLRAAEAACLLHRVPREDAIGKQALKFNEKFYLVDHGIRQALGYSNVAAVDQVIENVVYMELLRRGYEVRVGKVGDREIDFVATRGDERAYYQVTYLVASPETEEREFAPLEAVPDNHPKTVISLDEFPRSRNGIRGVHLADWLLE